MPTVKQQVEADIAQHGDTNKPGVIESFGRGLYSGATLGIAPGADQQKQEAAWQNNPVAYGTGYTGGTAGAMFAAPESLLLKGAGAIAGKVAPMSSAVSGMRSGLQIPMTGSQAGTALIKEKTGLGKLSEMMPEWIGGKPVRAGVIGTTEAGSNVTNTPSMRSGEISTAPTSVGPFGKLNDFLAQAEGTQDPQVLAEAQRAQGLVDESNPDSKRIAAMSLQSSPYGRAVSNSLSPYNQT